MARLTRKFDTARTMVPRPVLEETPGARVGIIAYGSSKPAIEEARYRLANMGLDTSFLRLRALPINEEVREFAGRFDRVYVIELNRDGQMHGILLTEMPEMATRLVSLAHMDGMPLTARWIVEAIMAKEDVK